MRKVPRVVRRRFTLNKTLYEIGMGFIRTEFLRDDSLEEIGVAEVFPQDEEIVIQDYEIEILEQPILERLEVRIEFAEIRKCEEDASGQSRLEKSAQRNELKTVVEELLTEQRLPERLQCFWAYIVG